MSEFLINDYVKGRGVALTGIGDSEKQQIEREAQREVTRG